jgi:hypothetical protein
MWRYIDVNDIILTNLTYSSLFWFARNGLLPCSEKSILVKQINNNIYLSKWHHTVAYFIGNCLCISYLLQIVYICPISPHINRIGGVMVIMLASSVVDHGFEPQSGRLFINVITSFCHKMWDNMHGGWVSEWLLLNANSAIFQLYYGESKLIFNEMMINSTLY